MTVEQAKAVFRELCRKHGLQWKMDVPRSDWERLAECNKVLTERDRRDALGLPS